VNADGIQSPNRAWIDLFAGTDLTITGGAGFAVHANGDGATNTWGGVITVKSAAGKVVTSGEAIQADGSPGGAGGKGGNVRIQAGGAGSPAGDVDFGTTTKIEATGNTSGGAPAGGQISVRSFNGDVLGSPVTSLDAHGDSGANPGSIELQGCGTG